MACMSTFVYMYVARVVHCTCTLTFIIIMIILVEFVRLHL